MILAPPPSDKEIAERIVTAFSWRGVALMGVAQNLSDEIERALSTARREARAAAIEECAQWCENQADFKGDLHDGIPGGTYRHTATALRAILYTRLAAEAVGKKEGQT